MERLSMTDQQLKEYCEAEFENIDTVASDLFAVVKSNKSDYSRVELAAISTFLHNIYNGFENILKRVLLSGQTAIRNTPTWHKEMLKSSFEKGIIDDDLYNKLSEYLAFRHFFVHSYSFNLNWKALRPLVDNLNHILIMFKSSILSYLNPV